MIRLDFYLVSCIIRQESCLTSGRSTGIWHLTGSAGKAHRHDHRAGTGMKAFPVYVNNRRRKIWSRQKGSAAGRR